MFLHAHRSHCAAAFHDQSLTVLSGAMAPVATIGCVGWLSTPSTGAVWASQHARCAALSTSHTHTRPSSDPHTTQLPVAPLHTNAAAALYLAAVWPVNSRRHCARS